MKIFIDTWGFKALIDSDDEHHNNVKKLFEDFWINKSKLFTTDYILDETITLLSVKAGAKAAKKFTDIIIAGEAVEIKWVEKRSFYESLELKFKYSDKPKISFTDFTSMAVMHSNDIKHIVTNDKHFESVNLGLKLVRETSESFANKL
ncbi:hypothetical protein BH10BAC5_BH10BAC5_28110 [soil metagenome]